MEKINKFTKLLAITGTVLVWIPILFTILLSLIVSLARGTFLFDFLMPAELFFIVLTGSLLLLWASLRARSQRKLIIWGLIAMLVFLFGGQLIAMIGGLDSGEFDPSGWVFWLVIASIALYSFSIIEVGIAGIILIKQLFRK